jgi:adenylate kinase
MKDSSRLNLIFIGRSGSGKGTQAGLMKDFLEKRDGRDSVFYIYTGEHLRGLITEHPLLLTSEFVDKKVMKGGNKAPDFIAIWAWAKELIYSAKPNQHIIFDGSPRTSLEAKALDEALEFYERKNVKPILLDVSVEEVKMRMLKRARADDTEKRIKNRLAYYEKYVVPAVEYYRQESKNKLIVIDGNPHDVMKIHHAILESFWNVMVSV